MSTNSPNNSNSTIDVGLFSATRKGSTVNGNPIWDIHTSEGTYRVQHDSSVSYAVTNFLPKREPCALVTLTLTRSGRVSDINLL